MAINISRITEASTAPAIDSTFYGHSKGTDRVERIVFKGFEDARYHVAIASKVNCFTRWLLYTRIKVRDQDCEKTVYVNNNSFRKRFDHGIEKLEIFNRPLNVGKCSATICGINKSISKEDIIEWVVAANKRPASEDPTLISNKDSQLGRSLLLSPSGNYVLLTKTSKGDKKRGEGTFKKVKYAVNLETGEKRVVAVLRRNGRSDIEWAALLNEFPHMQTLKGKEGVVQIDTAVITADKCYIVMEYCDQGDLYEALIDHPDSLTPTDKLQIAHDCATGLKNIHSSGLLHRDLKTENTFLYKDKSGRLRAKIGDLGAACPSNDLKERKRLRGTVGSLPPEIAQLVLQHGTKSPKVAPVTTEAIDVWALGLVYYKLFHPKGDFLSFQDRKTWKAITKIANLTQEALDLEINGSGIDKKYRPLIKDMLRINPAERLTMKQVQQALRTIR